MKTMTTMPTTTKSGVATEGDGEDAAHNVHKDGSISRTMMRMTRMKTTMTTLRGGEDGEDVDNDDVTMRTTQITEMKR